MWLQGRHKRQGLMGLLGSVWVGGTELRVCISLTGTGRQSKMPKMSPQFPSFPRPVGNLSRKQEFPICSDNQRPDQVLGLGQPLEDELKVWAKLRSLPPNQSPLVCHLWTAGPWLLIFRLWFFIFVIFYSMAAGAGPWKWKWEKGSSEIVVRLCNYLLMLPFLPSLLCCLCGHIKLSLFWRFPEKLLRQLQLQLQLQFQPGERKLHTEAEVIGNGIAASAGEAPLIWSCN